MHLIIAHKCPDGSDLSVSRANDLLKFALMTSPVADLAIEALSANCRLAGLEDVTLLAPEQWPLKPVSRQVKLSYYNQAITIFPNGAAKHKAGYWLLAGNARYVTDLSGDRLEQITRRFDADLIAVTVDPSLLSYREWIRRTSDGNIAGFRRLYSDAALPAPMPRQWPHYLFVRQSALDQLGTNLMLPVRFGELLEQFAQRNFSRRSVRIAGSVLDLQTDIGLLGLLNLQTPTMQTAAFRQRYSRPHLMADKKRCEIAESARFFGPVLLGNNVNIGEDTVIAGPAVICDNARLGRAAVIKSAIIGPDVPVPEGAVIQNHICTARPARLKAAKPLRPLSSVGRSSLFVKNGSARSSFRFWPWYSYPRLGKRIADIAASLAVLILFAPVIPIIAIAIKLNSSGLVFFRDRREGLHGRQFACLKFRTMIPGAESFQEKLRFKNRLDGPQFKVEDDPRTTVVGNFLRETYIDEIPQFFNVLLGQMSVVGPRPSPRAENSLCPLWRDARLSVRPGITGMWQVKRTRLPSRDFQEWIYYDTEYIKRLSLWLDLKLCWLTVHKLIRNFLNHF